MIKKISSILLIIISFSLFAQKKKKGITNIKKVGILYNYTDQNNFVFNDPDFLYTGKTVKIQAFYDLGKWKSFDFELIAQPQFQRINHQLLNSFFVLPTEENFLDKIEEFTTPKKINFYAFELGFVMKKEIFNNFNVLLTVGLGLGSIDTRTERLAKGFTFLENLSLGLSYKAFAKTTFYLGSNIGHISNLDTQKPNNGYSFLGAEVGIAYHL